MEDRLRGFYLDGVASQAMSSLTGGVFLAAFALALGASNAAIGLLAAIPPLTQLTQVPATWLIERYGQRKRIAFLGAALSRIFLLAVAAIPFLASRGAGLALLVFLLVMYGSLGAIGGCGWNSWMRDLLPERRLGRVFGTRMALASAVGIPLSLGAGLALDAWGAAHPEQKLAAYAALFVAGCAIGLLGLLFIAIIPDCPMAPREGKVRLLRRLREPLADANFRNLLRFSASWNFATNLAAPFFTVYMLSRLGLSLSWVMGLTVAGQVANLASLRLWGKFADRFSNKSVIAACGPLFLVAILLWTFTTRPGPYALTLPLLFAIHVMMGVATAGVNLALGNIALKLAPRGEATAYLATNGILVSLAAGVAPLLGGLLADLFSGRELALTLSWTGARVLSLQALRFTQLDFLFLFAFLLGLYSLHRLSLVVEEGEVTERIVVEEFLSEVRRGLRSLSSVAGLQGMIAFPFVSVMAALKKK